MLSNVRFSLSMMMMWRIDRQGPPVQGRGGTEAAVRPLPSTDQPATPASSAKVRAKMIERCRMVIARHAVQ
jgi:hypothetical protein